MSTRPTFTIPQPREAFGHYSPSVVELDGPFTHEMVHARGARFHVAQAGDPNDPLVVLLHGMHSGWFHYRYVIAPLAQQGYHVAAVDLRGYGMSDKPPQAFGYGMRAASGDIAGIIQGLGHHTGTVVGTDMGAAIAWCAGAAYPERVTKLVALSGAHPADLRRVLATHPWLMQHVRTGLKANTATHFHSSETFREEEALRELAAGISSAKAAASVGRTLLKAKGTSHWSPEQLEQPVSLIHPDTPLWRAMLKPSRRRAPALQSVTLPGVVNMPAIEAPEALVEALADLV